jgi:hypothetical protein
VTGRVTGGEREFPRDRGAPSAIDCRLRDVKCYYVIMQNLFKFIVTGSDNKVSICITVVEMMLMEAVVSYFGVLIHPSVNLRRMRNTIYNQV